MKTKLAILTFLAFSLFSYSQYCEPSISCSDWVHITNVSIGDINNTSACEGGFSDYSNQSTDIAIGSTGNIITLTGTNFGGGADDFVHFALWIDFNGNEDFTDEGEQIFVDVEKPIDVPAAFSFDVPSDAIEGLVRIRIGMSQIAGGWLDWLGPCGAYTGNGIAGEFEDYSINLVGGGPTALNADFSGTPTTIFVGESIVFTDETSGGTAPYTYNWSFGDGGTSSNENPSNTYNTEGVYSVSLTVTDSDNENDTETKTDYITVIGVPVVDFVADIITIEEGGSISFTDLSTNSPDSWAWTFEGGTPETSIDQNPVIVYNTAGIYDVTLVATNGAGDGSLTKTAYITVSNAAPVVDFSADFTTIEEGGSISFTDLSSNSPDSWAWTFEGGTPETSTDQNPVIVYNTAGIYDVTLVATNGAGNGELNKTAYITILDPVGIYELDSAPKVIQSNNRLLIKELNKDQSYKISVFNIKGSEVFSEKISRKAQFSIPEQFTSGLYIVQLQNENQLIKYKIIINK